MSNYWRKKLDELEGNNNSLNKATKSSNSSNYWQNKMSELDETNRKKNELAPSKIEDIAPVKEDDEEDEKEDEDRKWFEKGVFSDGYQFGDLSKTLLGTDEDIATNLTAGIVGMGEKVVDAGAYVAGGIGGWFGADDFKENMQEFISKDLYDEKEVAKTILEHGDKLSIIMPSMGGVGHAVSLISKANEWLNNDADDSSVLGDKSDSLIQSGSQLAATAGLQAAGVPWWLTTGTTSFGAETENAFKQDATYGKAGLSALISAGAEILTEKLSGGIKFGGSTLDDVLLKPFINKISGKTTRTLVNLGVDALGEGTEEVISSVFSNLGSALYKEESIGELLTSEEAMDEYLESFIGGAVLGGGMGGINATSSIASGRDYKSGLTTNEQKVVDKVYEERIAEAERNGEKLTKKEKSKIYDEVLEDLKKGGISIDTIESVLGGDAYKSYQDTVSSEDALIKELEELRKMKKGDMNDIQQDRLAELKAMNLTDTTKRNNLKAQLSESVQKQLTRQTKLGAQADSYLIESYNERSRRGQAFTADTSTYDAKQAEVVQKAIDSGILNNTRRTHEFVDMVAKISADKGVLFDFTNNAKLKESGFAIDGKSVNGYVTKDGITVNIDSAKSLNSVVGHEIAHVLEGTELYTEMQNALFEYAKAKGEYQSRLDTLTKLYEGVEGADATAELTADLVGDYLFTDSDFINNLSTEHRNVFKKIYDEIKYLLKIATAGSKEARELEKVKRAFDKAYRESGKSSADTKYSLSDSDGKKLTKEQSEYFKDSKMRDENGNLKVMYHGSQDAGFHTFDAKMSDDDTSFFFVDRNDVAASYSGTSETYEAQTIRTAEDMNNFLAKIGYDSYKAVEKDGKFELLENNEHVAYSDTAQGLYDEFCWYEGVGEGDANYKVYLNLTNPLEIDAKGRPWNKIDAEFSQEVYDRYKSLTAEEKAALTDLAEWEDFRVFNSEIQEARDNELASAYAKMGEDVNIYDLFSVAADNFSEDSMRENARNYLKTRDYAQRAKEQGYDGVIFKNLVDNGGYSNGSEGASTVAIAFDSNQIKSVANEKPTGDPDIRYSLSEDSKGRELSEEQREFFKDTKIKDKNGNLLVMYHGTKKGGFTVFENKNRKSTEGFYFTNDKEYSNIFQGIKPETGEYYDVIQEGIDEGYFSPETYEVYLDVKNPFVLTADQQDIIEDIGYWENIYKPIKARGYDGVMMEDMSQVFVFNSNQIKRVDNTNPTSNPDIRYSLSEADNNYLDAVNRGDTETAQRMVDEAAKEAGYTIKSYHGTLANDFTVFKKSFIGSRFSFDEKGFFFIDRKSIAKDYASSEFDPTKKGRVVEAYLKVKKPLLVDSQYALSEGLGKIFRDNDAIGVWDNYSAFLLEEAEAKKADGIIIDDGMSKMTVVFDSNQIKSADTVTYDNNGKVIPLSERFNAKNNDIRYSLSEDSDGRKLSDEQAKYFEGSKVVDDNGNLKVVYHGSPTDFNTFSLKYLGTNGTNEGYGFYFTDSKRIAEGYSKGREGQQNGENGKLFEVYLDIKKPLSDTEVTMSRAQFKKLLIELNNQVDEDGEPLEFLANYGDVEWEGLNKVLNYAMEIEYDGSDSDVNMVHSIINACGDKELVFDLLRKVTGYDGIIVNEATWGGDQTIYIAFHPEQIKNVDNLTPTTNPDIRYSLSAEGETPKAYGNFNIYAKDIRLAPTQEEVAPLNETTSSDMEQVEDIAPTPEDMAEIFPSEPNLYDLEREVEGLEEQLAKAADANDIDTVNSLIPRYEELLKTVRKMRAEEAAENRERIASFEDADAPLEAESAYSEADTTPLNKKTLTTLTRNVRDMLACLPKDNKAIREVIEKYSTSENPSKSELFKEIREKFGEKYEYQRYADIAEVKKLLNTYKFNVSDHVKGDIADYTEFKKAHNVRTSKKALSVDILYEELSGLYPGLFPADIINETDRFERISEVSVLPTREWVKVGDLSDNEIMQAVDLIHNEVHKYKNTEARKAAEAEARAHLDSIAPSLAEEIIGAPLGDPTLRYQGIYRDEEIKTVKERIAEKLSNVEKELADNKRLRADSIVDFNREIARLQEEYSEKANKNTKVANDILRRIERLQTMKNNVDADYAKRISDLEAKAEKMHSATYQTAMQRQSKMQEYNEWAADLIGDTTTWKDKKLGISYKTNTLKRNLRDVVRDARGSRDIAKADAIYDELQGKYNHNEAELNREANRIKKVFADMKITAAEDAYIQMLGELLYNPETTLTPDNVNKYYEAHKSKIDIDKVNEAIKLARANYDSLLERVNEVLSEQGMKEIPYRKGYFPHFSEEKQSWLAKLFNWKTHNTEIPTSIAGLTEEFTPNRSWQSFNKERYTDTTDYSFTKGFDTYVQGALDWIYHIEDIQKRRAFENHLRYIHSEQGIKDRVEALFNNEEYDADELQEQIDLVYREAKNPLNNFVTDLRAGTNTLANKKSSMDRGMEEATNRKFYSTMTNINNRVTGNMVVGSVSSALTNFIPITQSWSQVSPISTLRAAGETIRSTFRDDGVIDKSDFLTNRLKKADNLYKTTWDKISDKAAFMMEGVDFFTSQTVWRSKYRENLSKGMSESEAIKNADQFAEGILAGRSRGNQPTLFDSKNPLIKAFTAFQLEVNNQYGYMFKDMPQDMKNESKAKLVKGYVAMFVGAYAYNALYSSLTGRNAAFDPIRIIQELLGDLFDEDEEKKPIDAVMNLADNVIEELPFVGGLFGGGRIPISSMLPYGEGLPEMIDGMYQDYKDEDWTNLTKEWLNPLYYLAMPFGGGQLKKTIEGLSMFSEDHPIAGSYTTSGNLRFPVEDTFANRLQAGIFGQWANKNARDYFDNDIAPLNEKQTEEYIDVGMSIQDYWEYREGLKGLKTLEEKAEYINSLDLTDKQKNILINNIADRKEDLDMSNYGDFGSFEEFDYASKNPEKYAFLKENGISYDDYNASEESREAYSWAYNNPEKYTLSKAISSDVVTYRKYTSELYDIKADKDEDGKSISGSRKEKVIDYINNLDADYGEKIILFKSEYNADDTYNYEIIDYLNSREDISYQEMETILKELGFTVDSDGNIYWD